jgi:SAM-dependent methyltransferase
MSSAPWPDIAAVYDVVAEDYAAAFADELAAKPADRELLDRFAGAVRGRGRVWDVGCGAAGHVTRYLADRGADIAGVDISPGVIKVARDRQPGLEFHVADMCELPAGEAELAGIVAFYSLIHLPRARLPLALAEFHRVLAPGGVLLVAMHGGEGELRNEEWFGRPVQVQVTLVSPAELAAAVEFAGFTVREQHARGPYPGEHPSRRLYAWAERPLPPGGSGGPGSQPPGSTPPGTGAAGS